MFEFETMQWFLKITYSREIKNKQNAVFPEQFEVEFIKMKLKL